MSEHTPVQVRQFLIHKVFITTIKVEKNLNLE